MIRKTRVGIIGAGRIGRVHAESIANLPCGELAWIGDAFGAAAEKLASQFGVEHSSDVESVFSRGDIDAILICSPTDTHADLLEKASMAGKPVFCEKPIDLDFKRVKQCEKVLEQNPNIVQLGFNRRFDPGHAELAHAVRSGKIGKLQHLIIISRDPTPPPADYVAVSGGLFRDMMIHDFDMSRFITNEEPLRLISHGDCLIDKSIGGCGDVDTASVTLTMPSGTIATILNTRNCPYGYDQRIEAIGDTGSVISNNLHTSTVTYSDIGQIDAHAPIFDFFQTRYAESYRLELDHFLECVRSNTTPSVGFSDGVKALEIADAATHSLDTGHVVSLE